MKRIFFLAIYILHLNLNWFPWINQEYIHHKTSKQPKKFCSLFISNRAALHDIILCISFWGVVHKSAFLSWPIREADNVSIFTSLYHNSIPYSSPHSESAGSWHWPHPCSLCVCCRCSASWCARAPPCKGVSSPGRDGKTGCCPSWRCK